MQILFYVWLYSIICNSLPSLAGQRQNGWARAPRSGSTDGFRTFPARPLLFEALRVAQRSATSSTFHQRPAADVRHIYFEALLLLAVHPAWLTLVRWYQILIIVTPIPYILERKPLFKKLRSNWIYFWK